MKKIALILCGILAITSCEKSEFENESVEVQEASREEINSNHTTASKKPIFHATYDKNLTEKEANAKFEKDAKSFINKYKQKNSKSSSGTDEWFYRVTTRTGQLQNAQTDGDVTFNTQFLTDLGYFNAHDIVLDNLYGQGKDDREQGQWDYYIFRIDNTYGPRVKWVELAYIKLNLDGNDGWYVTTFNVDVDPIIQTNQSSGRAYLHSNPNVWLDNDDPKANNEYAIFGNGSVINFN
ncbi:hypothetical protein ABW636_10335 [Aquimarina sp. 2201CG1-2-11]|uniref:hypothetical protein n=1 Tax=Aquimarina discodermiae TaxID=3231043 RepID=UPI0034630BE7